jgi:hypothetical protein
MAPAEAGIATADRRCAILLDAVGRRQATVVVDMTRARFRDSRGLDVLLRAPERARAGGGGPRFLLVLPGDIPRVAVMCLDRLIPDFAGLAEARDRVCLG